MYVCMYVDACNYLYYIYMIYIYIYMHIYIYIYGSPVIPLPLEIITFVNYTTQGNRKGRDHGWYVRAMYQFLSISEEAGMASLSFLSSFRLECKIPTRAKLLLYKPYSYQRDESKPFATTPFATASPCIIALFVLPTLM